jgi:uncharacterized protein
MLRQTFAGAVRKVGAREVRVRMASNAFGRDNMIVEPAGIDLSDFRRNPIVLRDHDPTKPVARAIGFDQRPDALEALIRFASFGISSLADETYDLVRDGILNAVSIGFDVVDKELIDLHDRSAGTRVTKSTLLECSFVSVPADPQALVLERSYWRRQMANQSLRDHLEDLRGHIWDARKHHSDVDRALRRGDNSGAVRSHRELGRCLDRAEHCLRSLANEGAALDIENTSKAQNSDGMGYGTSDYLVPLSRAERWAEAMRLAGPVVGDGGAIGVQQIREREFAIAAGHAEAVLRAAALSQSFSRAQRQDDVRRLSRQSA